MRIAVIGSGIAGLCRVRARPRTHVESRMFNGLRGLRLALAA